MTAETSPFDAALQGMRETREQLRALRKALEGRVFGTPEQRAAYEAERKHVAVLEQLATRYAETPAAPRSQRLRLFGWWKGRGR